MMPHLFLLLLVSFLTNSKAWGQNKVNLSSSFGAQITQELKPFYFLSEGQIEDLLKGEVISSGTVDSPKSQVQRLFLVVAGIHPRNCTRAMRKLSLYENYSSYMDFIKTSSYDETLQRFSFTIDHTLLPFPMLVKFKIPRIKGSGTYPFVFEDGFLKGLVGKVIVRDVGKFCLLGLRTDWQGPETKIPSIIFGTFVQTVGKLGLEHLIRVSIF
jgi:hypothetical protein